MADVLVRWYDYITKTMKYGFLEGPTYGMQVCMKIWKLTHGEHLKKLGFKEARQSEVIWPRCRMYKWDQLPVPIWMLSASQMNGHYAAVDWIWSCNLKYSGSITEGACKHKGKISQVL